MKYHKIVILGLVLTTILPIYTEAVMVRRTLAGGSFNGSDLPISEGSLIEIVSYDYVTKTFKVQSARFPGEGESNVTFEALIESANSSISRARTLRFPTELVGQQFQISKPLPTLFEKEKAARKFRR